MNKFGIAVLVFLGLMVLGFHNGMAYGQETTPFDEVRKAQLIQLGECELMRVTDTLTQQCGLNA
jgi:hypothetical protein